MQRIARLSQSVRDKINAGEVIERPASVVKELVENALDAGATHIEVTIKRAGLSEISVSDNGKGIHPEDLILAFESHATSKIHDFEELSHIESFGFRGEALAAISSISECTLQSRSPDLPLGKRIHRRGLDTEQSAADVGMHTGTVVIARNLFFNAPSRLQFLSALTTELHHIDFYMKRFAMLYRHIRFTYCVDAKCRWDFLPAHEAHSYEQRLEKLFGKKHWAYMHPFSYQEGVFHLEGFVSDAVNGIKNNGQQYFFINNRIVKDPRITQMIHMAYADLIRNGRYPLYFLHLRLPAEMVDVNAHPAKLHLRFQDPGFVHFWLQSSLRRFLEEQPVQAHPVLLEHEVSSEVRLTESTHQVSVSTASDSLSDNNFGNHGRWLTQDAQEDLCFIDMQELRAHWLQACYAGKYLWKRRLLATPVPYHGALDAAFLQRCGFQVRAEENHCVLLATPELGIDFSIYLECLEQNGEDAFAGVAEKEAEQNLSALEGCVRAYIAEGGEVPCRKISKDTFDHFIKKQGQVDIQTF